ncbi:MAG: MBL fold metallo-hydrolase [Desulfobacterales bacterium]|nr:MBL fold metallo-hydrolase [Desulfobacterales bacterium]
MSKVSKYIFPILAITVLAMAAQAPFESDVFNTPKEAFKITFIGHGSLLFNFNEKAIYIDPFGKLADYSQLPKADIILITHEHLDHFDPEAIRMIKTEKTDIVLTQNCSKKITGLIIKNGDIQTVQGIKIEAIPAYNIIHKRDNGDFFHPKGVGNGYVITFNDKRVYIAGDTENIPEMKALQKIDIAFLPMNLPYTMTPEMVADAAKSFKPTILYPYHYGETNTLKIINMLKDIKDIDVRIRKMN